MHFQNILLLFKELLPQEVRQLVVQSFVSKEQVIAIGQSSLQLKRLVIGLELCNRNNLNT